MRALERIPENERDVGYWDSGFFSTLAAVQIKDGEFADALDTLVVLRTNPSIGAGLVNLVYTMASAQLETGDFAGARETWKLVPDDTSSLGEIIVRNAAVVEATAQLNVGDIDGAERTLDRYGVDLNLSADLQLRLAVANARNGDTEMAQELITIHRQGAERLESDPEYAEYWHLSISSYASIAMALADIGDLENAVSDITRAKEIADRYFGADRPQFYVQIAEALEAIGDTSGATQLREFASQLMGVDPAASFVERYRNRPAATFQDFIDGLTGKEPGETIEALIAGAQVLMRGVRESRDLGL